MAPPDPVRPGVVPADGDGIARAVYELRRGQLVAIPTDTVYGLACMASDREATGRIFSLKARPASVNLQVLVADAQSAARITKGWGPRTSALAERFWPGGLTMVVQRAPEVDWDLGETTETIGIRCPDHPVVRALCDAVGPLAATSANLHGKATPQTAEEVAAQFPGGEGGVMLVLDGGAAGQVASTVVDLTGEVPVCLREGAVPWEEVERCWKRWKG